MQYGGSFAPPLTEEKLAEYQSLISVLDTHSPIRHAMQSLMDCCVAWWSQPESTGDGRPHPSGQGVIINLDKPIAEALWDATPWDHELKAYGELFDKIDPRTEKPLRDAAHHLLWHGWELFHDREPMTADKL